MWLFIFILLFPLFVFSSEETITSYSFLKHREPKGVGYDTGYTSVDLMVNLTDFSHFYSFLNLRGHVFNEGRFASNFGLACRYATHENRWILGGNIYYDYRSTKLFSSQQLGGGAELFLNKTALRFNGYLPIGMMKRKESTHVQVALANLQGEVETQLLQFPSLILRGALGIYYFPKRSFNHQIFGKVWGSQIRLTATLYQWGEVGLEGTYDHIFNFTVQGYIALKIPIGSTRLLSPKNSSLSHLFQPIRRNEIIPMQKEDL